MRFGQPALRGGPLSGLSTSRQIGDALDRRRLGVLAAIGLLTASALAGWIAVIYSIDERDISDIGLSSVIPPATYVFIGLLAIAFVASIRMRPVPQRMLAAQLLALVVMLYAAPVIAEDLPRFVTAWLHVGFTDAIARTGELFPFRDARFDWPGFFVLSAFLSNLSGANDLVPILGWVPVVQVSLYLIPLYLIVRSATADLRLVWLALWVYVLTNWVGQDYFSPQGLNLLLALTIFAILLTWFRKEAVRGSHLAGWVNRIPGLRRTPIVLDPSADLEGGPQPHLTDRQQIGLMVIIVLLFAMSVVSHQLTPFAIIGGVSLLVIAGRLRARSLPFLMIVLSSAWLFFMAATFLDGRLGTLLEDVARPDQFAATNVAERLVGSAGHVLVVQGRLLFTLLVWLMALIGGFRRLHAGRLDLSLALLAVAPFGLMLAQGYGGEMVLRIFLFSLPFMAFFMAAAFMPTTRAASMGLSAMLVVASVFLSAGFVFTRYGNEKADIVTVEDRAAVDYVKSVAQPGALIASPNTRIAVEYRRWEEHRYPDLYYFFTQADLTDPENMTLMLDGLAERAGPGNAVYVVVTRSTRSHAELNWGMDDDEWGERLAAIEAVMETVYSNRDARVYRWTAPDAAEG
jgi:hypothetical protein